MKLKPIICMAFAGTLLVLAIGCSNAGQSAASQASGQTASAAISIEPSPESLPPASAAIVSPPSSASQDSVSPSPSPVDKTQVADGFTYMKLDDALKKRITGMSYPKDKDAQISYDDLRYISLKYYDFSGNLHTNGELIVNAKLAKEVTQIFYKLCQAKYPFTSVRLVDDYGEPGDDNLSMATNNTSAFNYRYVTGSKALSLHSFGEAIDINPRLNPYIENGRVSPANGAEYADRTKHLPGMIDHSDLCCRLFTQNDWTWSGDSAVDKDYQHFSKK